MVNLKATHQKTKQHNRDLVLKTIFAQKAISRAEIARVTKLTRATVSDLVATLIGEGLVAEVGYGSSIGGKSPILLSLVADSRYLIGVNLGQDKFIGAVVNLQGEIKETIEIPISDSDGHQALKFVYQILDRLMKKNWKPVIGIGIGTPGLVNTRDGVVVNAVNLDWQDLPLAKLLKDRYHLPVSVLNDSQANAIGEFVYGGNHDPDSNLVVVNVRHGIGAGILINGRLFQGDGGGAGEIGHVMVQENGMLCRCGKHGCLETVSSAKAVVQRARELAGQYGHSKMAQDPTKITLDSIVIAFQGNDPLAQRVVWDAAHYLGISIANLVGTLNIQKIVMTGEMSRFGEAWLKLIEESMKQSGLTHMVQGTRLEIGKLDFRGYILGASALMFLEDYSLLFSAPVD
ncbi:MAG TPA: ROK family transcriptional regulator [Anaerolineales bacterium]